MLSPQHSSDAAKCPSSTGSMYLPPLCVCVCVWGGGGGGFVHALVVKMCHKLSADILTWTRFQEGSYLIRCLNHYIVTASYRSLYLPVTTSVLYKVQYLSKVHYELIQNITYTPCTFIPGGINNTSHMHA